MFTGLVEATVPVRRLEPTGGGMRLTLPSPTPDWEVEPGASIAVSGCCLSVAEFLEPGTGTRLDGPRPGADLLFELSAETLARTRFGDLQPGDFVNLERSLRLGDRLGGHMVSGHVDTVGTLKSVDGDAQAGWTFRFEVPADFERYLIQKGSVAVDGISLTVVDPDATGFSVAVIPITFAETNLGKFQPGQRIHLEADQVGKWIEKLVAPHAAG